MIGNFDRLRAALVLATLAATGTICSAQAKFVCAESNGRAYFPQQGLVPANKAGFFDDGIKGGRLTLSGSGNDWDILFTDISGRVTSTVRDGGTVIVLHDTGISMTLAVLYPGGLSESYLFHKLGDGTAEVVWTQLKSGTTTLIEKGALYRAQCKAMG